MCTEFSTQFNSKNLWTRLWISHHKTELHKSCRNMDNNCYLLKECHQIKQNNIHYWDARFDTISQICSKNLSPCWTIIIIINILWIVQNWKLIKLIRQQSDKTSLEYQLWDLAYWKITTEQKQTEWRHWNTVALAQCIISFASLLYTDSG